MTKPPPATPLPRCPGVNRGTRHSNHQTAVTIDGCPLDWQASLALRTIPMRAITPSLKHRDPE